MSLLVALAGCAGNRSLLAELQRFDTPIELTATPFHAQSTDQCGPAALATLLNTAGIAVGPEELRRRVYVPELGGSIQPEMLAAARAYGRIPYVIDPDLPAVVEELRAGRPVGVLQNLGARAWPVWHYAVVIGYLPEEDAFVLRSGETERHVLHASRFLASWQRAGNWAFVILEPGDLPARPVAVRYLQAVAAVESAGLTDTAMRSYAAATRAWPDNAIAWLGLGNTHYAHGDPASAFSAYSNALELAPGDAIAINNLAQVYADRGCTRIARELITDALAREGMPGELERMLRESHASFGENTAADCPVR